MKKLLMTALTICAIMTGCANQSSTTQTANNASQTINGKYISVQNITLANLLKKINAKEDFIFIVTRGEDCTPCADLMEYLKTFEAAGKTIYVIDLVDLTKEQQDELNEKLDDTNYSSRSHFSGVPSTHYFSPSKQIYLQREGYLQATYDYFLKNYFKKGAK